MSSARPNYQIVLQETVRRTPVVLTATASTASDPVLRSVSDAIPIVADVGGSVARIRCITCDGKGNLLPGAILRIFTDTSVVTGMVNATTFTTGTRMNVGNFYTITAGEALRGGFIEVKSDAKTAEVNVSIDFTGAGATKLTLEHLWYRINAAITLT